MPLVNEFELARLRAVELYAGGCEGGQLHFMTIQLVVRDFAATEIPVKISKNPAT